MLKTQIQRSGRASKREADLKYGKKLSDMISDLQEVIRHYKLKGIGLGTMEGLGVQKKLEGYIKKHRKILGSEIMAETGDTYKLFDVVVLLANWLPKPDVNGAKRGQLITTWAKLAAEAKMSSKTVARGLERLEKLGMVQIETERGKGSVITVVNYGKYQSKNDDDIGQNVRCSDAEQMQSIGQNVLIQQTNCPKVVDKMSETFQEKPSSDTTKTAPKNIKNIKNINTFDKSQVFIGGTELSEELLDDAFLERETKPKRAKKAKAVKPADEKKLFEDVVRLTDEEHSKLVAQLGGPLTEYYIKAVNAWLLQHPEIKSKSDYGRIKNWRLRDETAGRNPLLDGTLKKQPYMTEAQKKNEILKQMWLEADAEEKAAKAKTEKQGDMVIDAKMEVVSR